MDQPALPGTRPTRTTFLVAAGTAVVLAVAGLLVGPARPPMVPPGGRVLPRVPGPPDDFPTLLRRLGIGSFTWYACAVAIPSLWWCASRWPITTRRGWRSAAVQLGVLLVLIAIVSVAHYLFTYGPNDGPPFAYFAQVAVATNAVPLLAIAAAVNVIEMRRRAVLGAFEAERLRAELAESRLLAVTSQLQPHFLFNTLQSISTLIHRDPDTADAMLAKLSDLLREVLRRSQTALVPLADELRMTGTYLELAQLRFGERLRVHLDVGDAVGAVSVPMLLLQPFVENAIKHGVGRRASGGTVGITVHRRGDWLIVTVWDDGEGLEPSWVEGTGLANARERLRHAYGDGQSLVIAHRPGGGTVVTMDLPATNHSSGSA